MKTIGNLRGKTALITGASSGIGREFARQMAAMGIKCIVTARNTEKLQDLSREIKQKQGEDFPVEIITGDLENPETPGEIFYHLKQKEIFVDILVNNAGFGNWSRFEEESNEKSFRMNMLNVTNLASMCHLFIPPMLEKGRGGVINVSSTAGFQPMPYSANYGATKAFVLNLSLGLWQEYKDRGVTVTALAPGYTRTGFQKIAGMPKRFANTCIEPGEVVSEALEAFAKGEPLIIPRAHRSFLQFTLSKFVPLKMRLKMTADMFRPE